MVVMGEIDGSIYISTISCFRLAASQEKKEDKLKSKLKKKNKMDKMVEVIRGGSTPSS